MIILINERMHEKVKKAMQGGKQDAGDYHEQVQTTCVLLDTIVEEKRRRKRIGFGSFMKRQVSFVGWKIWFMQGVLFFLLYGIFTIPFSGYFRMNVSYMAFFLCCLTVLLMMSAAPILYRSVRYTMYEVELVCRFSMISLLFARICIIGIGNLAMLGGVLGVTVVRSALRMESALLYILLSFLAAGGGFLYLLGHWPAEKFLNGSIGFGSALIGLLFLLRRIYPAFFTQTFTAGWAAVCLVLFAFCIGQMHYFLCRSSYVYA